MVSVSYFFLKGKDRLDMVNELEVQNRTGELQDLFDTNETFLRCAICCKAVQYRSN